MAEGIVARAHHVKTVMVLVDYLVVLGSAAVGLTRNMGQCWKDGHVKYVRDLV